MSAYNIVLMLMMSSFQMNSAVPVGGEQVVLQTNKGMNKPGLTKYLMTITGNQDLLKNHHLSGRLIRRIRQIKPSTDVPPPVDITPPSNITAPTHFVPPTNTVPSTNITRPTPPTNTTPPTHITPLTPPRNVTPPINITPPTSLTNITPPIYITPPTHIAPPTYIEPPPDRIPPEPVEPPTFIIKPTEPVPTSTRPPPIAPPSNMTAPTHFVPPINTTTPTNTTRPTPPTNITPPIYITPPTHIAPPTYIEPPPDRIPPEPVEPPTFIRNPTEPVPTSTIPPPKHLCETESFDPSTIQCINSSMSHAYSCESRCGDPTMIPGVDKGPYCSCHPLCLISHDCCQDFKQFCPQLHKLGERKRVTLAHTLNSIGDLDCTYLHGKEETFWMVGHCPLNHVNQTEKIMCEGVINNFIQTVPVVSESTELTYKNYFCAQCNNVLDVIPWGLNVTCAEVWEGSLESPETLLQLVHKKKCYLEYKPVVEHYCVSKALRQSDCNYESLECLPKYKDQCEYGLQIPVSVPFLPESFRNIYCLMCVVREGFPMSLASCSMKAGGLGSEILDAGLAKFSFGILVDYNPSGGNTVGFVFKDDAKIFGCSLGNSENMDCVSYCADGFQYTNGKCVLKYQTFDMTVTGMWSMTTSRLLDLKKWKELKKTLTELFVGILESCIIEVIKLEHNFNPGYVVLPGIQFNITGQYKLNVRNIIPLIEIHTTMFNNILSSTISAFPKTTSTEMNLFSACLTLFGQSSCWDHGRITTSGDIITINTSTVEQNKTANGTSATPLKIHNTTDCPRKVMDPSSVEILTNGSVLLTDNGHFLKDEFLLAGNMVYVCVNETGEFVDWSTVWKYDETMGLLTIICSTLSLICMFIRLILQPFVPLFQNFPGKLQFLFILSLFLASLFFLIGPNCTAIKELCTTLGVVIHWSYLAVFTWTVIIARDMFYIFSPSSFAKSTDRNVSVLKVYTLLAWGIPAGIVAISLGLDYSDIDPTFKPMYGRGICWISQRYALLIFFTAPIAITILLNLGFFIPTAVILWKSTHQRVKRLNKATEYPFGIGIYVKLICLMGFTWIFAFIAPYNTALWYIFIVLNASQGVYIFIAFVLRKKVWDDFSLLKKSKDKSSSNVVLTNQTERAGSLSVNARMRNGVVLNVNDTNIEMKHNTRNGSEIKLDHINVTEMQNIREQKQGNDVTECQNL